MSETGSDFDVTDATDSPFECLSDGNGNGKGKRHVDTAGLLITDRFIVPNRPPANMPPMQTPVPLYQAPGVTGNVLLSNNPVHVPMVRPLHQQHQPSLPVQSLPADPAPAADAEMTQVLLTSQEAEKDESMTPPESTGGSGTSGGGGGEEDGLLSWISSGSGSFLSRVAEKAKNSVDSVITTLDPGMKEYLYSGGGVNIIVASDKECKVSPIREAFIDVFGRATVKGITASPGPVVAAQPVGTQAAQVAASERIAFIRRHLTNQVPQNQVIVALENFLIEMSPGCWYDMGCLYLDDPMSGLKLVTYTQSTPVPYEAMNYLKFETPNDYVFRESGFQKTIGHFMMEKLSIPNDRWHEAVVGIPRRSIVYMAACALAKLFKDKLAR